MSRVLFVADENLDERLVLALLRQVPHLDVVRVRDTSRAGSPDPDLLEWAAEEGRVLITHDARSMPCAACGRLADGHSMPGVLIVPDDAPARAVLDDLVLIAELGESDDWRDRVVYLPLPE